MSEALLQLTPQACQVRLDAGALLVDVREPHEVASVAYDHPACVNMPLSRLQQHYGDLPRDRSLIMACAAGGRSMQALQFLAHHGYTQLANLQGGMGMWLAQGLPVRRG